LMIVAAVGVLLLVRWLGTEESFGKAVRP